MNQHNLFKPLFDEALNKVMVRPGNIISATIVKIDHAHVYLDAGLKADAFIPLAQFKDDGELAVGQVMRVHVISLDDGHGDLLASREKAKDIEVLEAADTAMKENRNVVGQVIKAVKGGYTVIFQGLRAFLPGSLVGNATEEQLVNQTMEFKIVRIDNQKNNIVLSRKAAFEEQHQESRKKALENIKIGDVFNGTVKNITNFGVFVDIGNFDGLVHIADISWKRIKHPSDVVTIGQKVNVQVLNCVDERLSLGMKQLEGDPWLNIVETLEIGSIVKGQVTNITDYGCFISMTDGIEGLVHSTAIDWQHRSVNPHKYFSIGDSVDVKIMDIDLEKHRIALSIKDCKENPWVSFAQDHKRGDIVQGKIVSITEFGIFLNLTSNVDGLIHISDVANSRQETEILHYKKGQELEAMILSIDAKKQRITLGLKQLRQDAKPQVTQDIGDRVKCQVTEVLADGSLRVDVMPHHVPGFIAAHHLTAAQKDELTVNASCNAYILTKEDNKSLTLSLTSEYKKAQDHMLKSTIGQLINQKLQENSNEDQN